MDPNSNYTPNKPDGFAIASLVCGILSIILCCTGILGIPVGSLSILFAVLSKRKEQRMSAMSLFGIWLAIAGITLGVLMTTYSFFMIFNNPVVGSQLDEIMREMYGMDFEAYLDQIF